MLGPICRVDRLEEVLESLRDYEEEQFRKEPELAEDAFASTPIRLASSVFGGTAHLTAEDREEALAKWWNGKTEHVARGREHFMASVCRAQGSAWSAATGSSRSRISS
ncbi:hypothetical protein [Pseudarthrobacter siccitolerans]|uniref:hypothetical protein n=1 Tax=Pseudarthrobacter siccitolerans TaxID=861266 RepID=UPI000ABF5D58|nr:hypothetical protein [Pseudarthrobacter siccitolerans]